ncbi:MAG: PDZ domain-containing protein [Spirochaetaceae bacterium]|nr:MAG: PDZ domain-containing protein [Spirochaetaceae bacterium]
MKRWIRPAILISVLLALTACAGMPSRVVEPEQRREVIRRDIDSNITSDAPELALQRLVALRRDSLFEPRELDRMYDEAVTRLAALVQSAVDEGAFRLALRRYRSLETLGRSELVPDHSGPSLLLGLVERHIGEGNDIAGLHTLLGLPDLGMLNDQQLESYAEIARRNNNRYVLQQLVQLYEERGIDTPQEYDDFLASRPTATQLIDGTVTVWVNKGVRLERGVGIPDRVIGSGFFIDKRGYLITNYHVIKSEVDPTYRGYSRLYVRLPGAQDRRIPARVVGYDRIFDIALLKVEIDPSYIFSFTEIRTLEPGASIYAIGSPGGLENSITSGIISATGRRFLQMGDAMQVDVPVNPGNSGGPVVNSDGDLVGVVFAGIPQFQGVNFAIPSYWINHFLPRLYEPGEVKHPWLGVAVHENSGRRLEVVYVSPRSPADIAGLQAGDILTDIAGWTPSRIGDAQTVLLDLIPGELISVSWTRDDDEMSGYIAVAERPYSPVEEVLDRVSAEELFPPLFGMDTDNISTNRWQRNYVVTRVYSGSIADETGLSERDPFSLQNWRVDLDRRIAVLQIIIRQRKAGFLESGLQLATFLDLDNFL